MNTVEFKQQLLDKLYTPYKKCRGCHFQMPKATQFVFGEGNPNAQLVLIGEAPGKEEDLQGKPFVGRSGKLLTKILESIGFGRNEVYITNIVKTRPPNNRRPYPQEIDKSRPFLYSQIKIIRPKVICTLGSAALEGLLGKQVKISELRGQPIKWQNLTIIPTYHPAYILRNPQELETLINDIAKASSIAK